MKTKLGNTWFSKFMALCLAVVMMLSMSMTVFAVTNADKGGFTITGFDTDPAPTVTAYQIITVNIDDDSEQPAYPMYTWASNVATWMTQNEYDKYIDSTLGQNAVADAFGDADAADVSTFLEKMTAAIKAGKITELVSEDVTAANGSANFTRMDMGEYLITAKGGVKIYQPTTVKLVPEYNEGTKKWGIGEAVIGTDGIVKSVTPDIPEKEASTVDGGKTVAIGDVVTYTLTVNVPSYPADATHTKFEVSDKLGAGFTFNDGTIKVYSNETLKDEINDTNYKITVPSGEKTFLIAFNKEFTTTYSGTTVYITYEATVNKKAFTENALGNAAFLGYDNDPYQDSDYVTPGTHEDVYTYGIQVKKVDSKNAVLPGAQFKLSLRNKTLKFTETDVDGVYNYDPTSSSDVLEVSAQGVLKLQGLDEGIYTLEETKAPNGYVLPTGTISIVIADEVNGAADGSIDAVNVTKTKGTVVFQNPDLIDGTKTDNIVSLEIVNTSSEDAGFDLPVTGGMGTMLFTIAGILLMGGAVALVVVAVRKRRA